MTKTIDLRHPEFADPRFGLNSDGTPFRLLPGIGLLHHPATVEALRRGTVSRTGRGVTRVDCGCGPHGAQWSVPGAGAPVCDRCLENAKRALKTADEKSPPPGPGPGHLDMGHPALFAHDRPTGRPVGYDLLVRPRTVAALRAGEEVRFVHPNGDRTLCSYCFIHLAAWTVPGASFHPCDPCLQGAKQVLAEVGADDDPEAA